MKNRRNFIKTMAAASAPLFIPHLRVRASDGGATGGSILAADGLGARAKAKNMFYGAAVSQDTLSTDTNFRTAVTRECGIIVPDYEMKWDRLRPTSTTFNFTDADYLVNFARQNGILFRGHTLCWHRSLPTWFASTVNSGNAAQYLTTHIQTVMSRYAGQIHSWDVVNEAIEPADNKPNYLRNSPWYQFLGESYIETAFRAAAKADPKAMLVYNEYNMEFDDEVRRNAIYSLLQRLKSKGVPIHALGIQGHMRYADLSKFNANKNGFRTFLNNVAALGLKIIISEFDVDDSALPANTTQRDAGVAQMYGDYCGAIFDNPALIGFITWGLSDKYSAYGKRSDGQPQRPLPLDPNFERKSSWYALEWWFSNTTTRPQIVGVTEAAEPARDFECFPNPAATTATIRFVLPTAQEARLSVTDERGAEVATIFSGKLGGGAYNFAWNTETVANGVYICVLNTATTRQTLKIVVKK